MTFYEAAVEVLRRTGRPLHFKKITEAALRDQLLSHVGKTPEATMEDRLDQETKKEDASWIVRTRPGVYMLRAEVAERLNAEAKEREAAEAAARAEREEAARRAEEERQAREAERRAAQAAARAEDSEAEDDEEEDDDLEASDDEDDDEDETVSADRDDSSEPGTARGRRRRRRRGGRRRGGDKREQQEAAADLDAADDEEDDEEELAGEADESAEAAPAAGDDGADREDREDRNGRRGRRRGRGRDRDRDRDRKEAAPGAETLQGERFESIAEAAFAVLRANGRRPMSAEKVAATVFEKKLVKFHTHDPEATIESAIVTDNQVRSRAGRRPLFAQYRNGRWGLTEWGVSDDGIDKERQILALTEQLRDEAHGMLGEAVARLKAEAFEMVVMTLLERLDYRNLKVSKRTADGGTYFSADWRRGFSDLRVCVHVVSAAQRTLEAAAIEELRETLGHYSATEGIIVHIGEISRDAVRDSRKEGEPKVTIIDRKTFVRLLVEEGIGVRVFQTPLVMVDTAFIDALQR